MKVAIIPARIGSKRIPKKNIKNFCGKPMIASALKAASKSQLFDKIHVSHLLGNNPATDKGAISYVTPKDRAIDIDDAQDLAFAEKLFLGQQSMENEKK